MTGIVRWCVRYVSHIGKVRVSQQCRWSYVRCSKLGTHVTGAGFSQPCFKTLSVTVRGDRPSIIGTRDVKSTVMAAPGKKCIGIAEY